MFTGAHLHAYAVELFLRRQDALGEHIGRGRKNTLRALLHAQRLHVCRQVIALRCDTCQLALQHLHAISCVVDGAVGCRHGGPKHPPSKARLLWQEALQACPTFWHGQGEATGR